MFGGCFSSREARCRVRIPATFWTQQKSLPLCRRKRPTAQLCPFSVFSQDPGFPSLWRPVTVRSSSLTSDMVLLKDSLIIALGLGTVVSVMCKLGLSRLRFPRIPFSVFPGRWAPGVTQCLMKGQE